MNGGVQMLTSTVVVQQGNGNLGGPTSLKSRHHLSHSPSLSNGSSFLSPSTNGRIPSSISPQMRRAHPQPQTVNPAPAPTRVFKFDNVNSFCLIKLNHFLVLRPAIRKDCRSWNIRR